MKQLRHLCFAVSLSIACAVVVEHPFLGSIRANLGIGPVERSEDEPDEQSQYLAFENDESDESDAQYTKTVVHDVRGKASALTAADEDPDEGEHPPLHPRRHEPYHPGSHEGHHPGSHEGHAAAGEEHGAAPHHHGGHHSGEKPLHHHPGEGHAAKQHHHHEESDPEAFGLACFLMGGVAAVMMVFYLVNNHKVKGATWKVLNTTASIFVAVLIYGTIKSMLLEMLDPGFIGEVSVILLLFFVSFLLMHFVLWKVKMCAEGEDEDVEGVAVLMAHVTGFAAMYGFADAAELPFFEEMGIWGPPVLIVLAILVLVVLSQIMDKVMQKVANADGEVDEDEWRWIELCQETDDDVICLTLSFLLVLWIRYLIRGTNKPYEPGHAGNVVQTDCTILWLVALLCVGIVLILTVVHYKVHHTFYQHHGGEHFRVLYPKTHRAMIVIQHLSFMTCAWCFLFWGEWQLYALGWSSTIIGGSLVVAVVLSLLSFACVLIIYYFLDVSGGYGIKRALKSFELSLGILVGFSWERAFDVGFEEMELKFESMEELKEWAVILFYVLNFFLFITVAPAWRLYIFPTAKRFEKEEEEAKKNEDKIKAVR